MITKIERICISCGKVDTVNKCSYNSDYCRPCSLKIENRFRHMTWEQLKKMLDKEYQRGLRDSNKILRKRLLTFIFKDFPFLRKYDDRQLQNLTKNKDNET